MKTIKTLFLFLVITTLSVAAYCQKNSNDIKIKSIVISGEKSELLAKKQFKESETYFDLNGNEIESVRYKLGKVDKHLKYYYDSDNNKIKEEELDASGRIKVVSEYKYEEGLRTEKVVYDQNGKVKYKKIYSYTKY